MKPQNLLLCLGAIFLCTSVLSNENIHFEEKKTVLSEVAQNQIDHAFNDLPHGESVSLTLINKVEYQSLKPKQISKLTFERAKAVLSYCREKEIGQQSAYGMVAAFKDVNHSGHQIVTNGDYRSFANHGKGIHSVVLEKNDNWHLDWGRMYDFSSDSRTITFANESGFEGYLNGAYISIPSYSFKGLPCDSVNFKLDVYNDINDILVAGLVSQHNGELLETGGMLFAEASDCNGTVRQPSKKITFRIDPCCHYETKPDMELFRGESSKGIVNWHQSSRGTLESSLTTENMDQFDEEDWLMDEGFEQFYEIETSRLGWINIDKFPEIENPGNIYVNTAFNKKEVAVRMVFKEMDAVMAAHSFDTKGGFAFNGVPMEMEVMIYCIGKKGDQYYFDLVENTLTSSLTVDLSPRPIEKSILEHRLQNLTLN